MLYVVAIGGNALTDSRLLSQLSRAVAKLRGRKHRVLLTHGNGPQVGELAAVEKEKLSFITAQTQAVIGMEMQESIEEASRHRVKVAAVLTKVLVSEHDPAFSHPTKPIGRFLSKREAVALKRRGMSVRLLEHGYRRVVPSPKPQKVFEIELIKKLLNSGYVVIAGGGGGIAVAERKSRLLYEEAVIDKDLTSSLLAKELKADRLVVLTNVKGVFLNFMKRNERMIPKASVKQMLAYAKKGEFEEGSMLPKIVACTEFSKAMHEQSVIGSLEHAEDVLLRQRGCTLITP